MNRLVKILTISILLISSMLSLTSCKKKPTLPIVTTNIVTAITQTTATTGGDVTGDGGAEVTSKGVCWNTLVIPTVANSKTSDGTGTGSFSSNLTQLTPNTLYYVRAYATNSSGTGYGNQVSFKTDQALIATLTTTTVTSIGSSTAVSGGNITTDGGGSITERGLCWSTNQNPTIADNKTTEGIGTGPFTSIMTSLTPDTTYYVRAYATNSTGTGYGEQISFRTLDIVTDVDGNVYQTVKIGTQIWMSENLKTTEYQDGTAISYVIDNMAWVLSKTGAYCWYNNSITNKAVYGALYNWYTVSTNKLCPNGWHVPSDAEWTTLTTYLGGESGNGGKLKEAGTAHWASPNTGATNETGFTAVPGGVRSMVDGNFFDIGATCNLYSSDEVGTTYAWIRVLWFYSSDFGRGSTPIETGYSVRCIKDN